MKFILLIILILWLVKITKDVLFWNYLWQLKEYRLDRMKAHFELPSAKRIFVNKLYLTRVALLASSSLLAIHLWQTAFTYLVLLFYALTALWAFYGAASRKIRKPVFTKKTVIISACSLFVLLSSAIIFYAILPSHIFIASLLAMDIISPLVVSFIVLILKFPSEILKNRVIEKAASKRKLLKNVLVVGVTGSYGKTSMKECLAHILSQKLKVLSTPKNQNSEMGVANTILTELTDAYDVFIAEMGAYRIGEIKRICYMAKPQIGILTGINEQHVSLFGSIENTMKAKYELIESLPRHGLAIFNGENEYTNALYEGTKIPKRIYALRSFSVSKKPDISCEKITCTPEGTSFYLKIGDTRELFSTPLLGRHNVLNILGASLAAHNLGMSIDEIKEAVKTLKAPPRTLEQKPGINNSTLIDDSYSGNPTGVYAALEVLEQMRGNKKILVMYPLIELGKSAIQVHRQIALKINKACELCILTSNDFAREIAKNAPNTDIIVMSDPQRIIAKLQKTVKEGDVVLIENRVPEEIINFLAAEIIPPTTV